jgi:hypothetical protein
LLAAFSGGKLVWVTVEDGFITLKLKTIFVIYFTIFILILLSYLGLIPVLNWLLATLLIGGFIAIVFGEWGGEDMILRRPLFYFGIIVLIAGALLMRRY